MADDETKRETIREQAAIISFFTHPPPAGKEGLPYCTRLYFYGQKPESRSVSPWIAEAKESGTAQLKQFASGLQRDYQAIYAALSMEWSNGQVEGQINRLKLIKCQGYGRAKLDLLKKRVLYKPTKQAA